MKKPNFRSLEIVAKTIINSFGAGSHISSLKDAIIDVDITREYQPGDKRLDSRASLKMSQTMSRVFIPDKCMTTMIVLDLSSSQQTKITEAITTCLYLTYLADLANDNIGIVTFTDSVIDFVNPSQDRRNVIDVLNKSYNKELSGKTNLEAVLKRIELTNSMVVVISDFCYDISDRVVGNLRRIASGTNNTVVSLAMFSANEWQFNPMPFSVNFSDAESGEQTTWNFKNTNNLFQEWQKNLKIKLRQAKSEPIFANVDQSDYLMPLVKYFLRSQR